MTEFTFVDLFAGMGGFHQALAKMGGKCVSASEIDKNCIDVYKLNFPNTSIIGDITKEYKNLPKFDVLCGGFPCQPFSKAGKQQGFSDPHRGNLFYTVIEILKLHDECKFLILENVKNLADKTENWQIIKDELRKLNFYVTDNPIILSPSQFGIPQIRERVYILGIRKDVRDSQKLPNGFIHMEDLGELQYLKKPKNKISDVNLILEKNYPTDCRLSEIEKEILDIWLEFKKGTNFDSPHVPIWLDFFGFNLTDHEYKKSKFKYITKNSIGKHTINFGTIDELPEWKKKITYGNRNFYVKHKEFIDSWINKTNILTKPSIYKKFEWHCGKENQDYLNTIIQFRQSGIRVKRNDYFPALVAVNNTPIIFDKKNEVLRKISPREAANLQSFKEDYLFLEKDSITYKQLGNSVNIHIVEILFKKLMNFAQENWKDM